MSARTGESLTCQWICIPPVLLPWTLPLGPYLSSSIPAYYWALPPTQANFCHSGAGHTSQNWWVTCLPKELIHLTNPGSVSRTIPTVHGVIGQGKPLYWVLPNSSSLLFYRCKSHQSEQGQTIPTWTYFSYSRTDHTSKKRCRPQQSVEQSPLATAKAKLTTRRLTPNLDEDSFLNHWSLPAIRNTGYND